MSSRSEFSVAVALLAIMVGVGEAEVRGRAQTWIAPAAATAKVNPLSGHTDAERGGAKLFAARCATCHGDDGRGSSKGPDLTGDVQTQSDGALFWKISSGNSRVGMPSFSFMPEAQRWQLVLRVRSLAAAP